MTLREAMQSVYDTHGRLTPALVVETARDGQDDVARFLRDRLEWDDAEGAERWRLEQAQRLIQKVRAKYRPTPRSADRDTRFWVSMPSPQGRSYEPLPEVARDELSAAIMLREAERAWRELKARYGHLAEFVRMVQRDLEKEEAA